MKINKISTKLIKPLTPTPLNLKNYHISFLDQHVVKKYIAVVLYYQSVPADDRLEGSLAETLVHFYPLAGRYIKTDLMVDCSDQGAEFVEAEAQDAQVTDLIGKTDTNHLCPEQYFGVDEGADDPLLLIQMTRFPCDGRSLPHPHPHPIFRARLVASAQGRKIRAGFERVSRQGAKDCCEEAFVWKGDLTRLKRERSTTVSSGVRVACAVIAKSLIRLDRATHGKSRDFVVFQPINMRERTSAPPPKNACGNMSFGSFTRRVSAEEEIGIEELVDLIGDGVRKSIAEYAEILCPDRDGRDIIINVRNKNRKQVFKPETFVVSFTDWSKFGFYEVDFGWGKPIWSGVGPQRPRGNHTILMRSEEGDGIEAWLHLKEDDMDLFEQDEEIKLFMS
ncbi:pelargonidin 3-O-(6-caffeoylglucoside) 5-O-(6-O-malonylglucoside) 4'''-malonyltransferase [Salvia divinorum]|uniref:Pelargonidin 3-O-(6-caffeoylglucoside) 5-O-(6-O-malonylglucoside) 4'''-malonyltransferase n=1 Tax=Salvia divinorum TaxID=28513 RepID=A0ABD1FMX5_SALDI